jgi:hypothetical protein
MRSNLPVLQTLKVASPCDASWEAMAGDDRRRFCNACEKFVYNLPLLSPEELVDLIERTEGRFCGRLYARTDGTVLTNDCPVGHARMLARARRRTVGAAAAVAAMMISAGAAIFSASWGGCEVGGEMTMGDIGPPPGVVQTTTPPSVVRTTMPPPDEPPPVEPVQPLLGDIMFVEPPVDLDDRPTILGRMQPTTTDE